MKEQIKTNKQLREALQGNVSGRRELKERAEKIRSYLKNEYSDIEKTTFKTPEARNLWKKISERELPEIAPLKQKERNTEQSNEFKESHSHFKYLCLKQDEEISDHDLKKIIEAGGLEKLEGLAKILTQAKKSYKGDSLKHKLNDLLNEKED